MPFQTVGWRLALVWDAEVCGHRAGLFLSLFLDPRIQGALGPTAHAACRADFWLSQASFSRCAKYDRSPTSKARCGIFRQQLSAVRTQEHPSSIPHSVVREITPHGSSPQGARSVGEYGAAATWWGLIQMSTPRHFLLLSAIWGPRDRAFAWHIPAAPFPWHINIG